MNKESQKNEMPESILPYLNEIADRLWAGRAAVMVGAGFSKNASKAFPDWFQLGDLFYEKSYGKKPNLDKKKYQNPLRLAEEAQAAIGRPALENLLRSSIPNLSVEPSDLHVQLLELPWADVFTTNYDTLLERASAGVVTRRYEPVVNKEDIPYAVKPRIVKPHGSFPSERPFIITEEDYRRYPYEFAPFVNTVQQALLENTFCLIGFSGDDPNFLQWMGWIQDNLGKDKTQKIYLVGLSSLSPARLQLLAQRGVIFIDLSQCTNIEKGHHGQALNYFFQYLQLRRPNALDWPSDRKTDSPSYDDKDRLEKIQKVTEEWREQRQAYPGWLVLPQSNRETLWIFTQSWVGVLPDIDKVKLGLDIQYVYELIWRLERCLLPIFSNVAKFYEQLIEKYKTKNDFRGEWLAISLAMLRFYREEGLIDKWEKNQKQIKQYLNFLSEDQKEFLNYEEYLFNLFKLDLPNAKQSLEQWRPNESQPYWVIKKASALAEMGQLNEAATIVKDALENIRKKLNQKAGVSDLTLVSQESYAMLLARYIQSAAALEINESSELHDEKTQFNDRWNELKIYKCDPWNELKLFELRLEKPPVQQKNVTEKREFDIGRITHIRHWINSDDEVLHAYAFLRFSEELGLPFRINNHALATKTAEASLQRISQDSPFLAIATLVRLGDDKVVDKLFNRESVYQFTLQEADSFIQNYLDVLKKCQNEIHAGDAFRQNTFCVRLAQLLPEIISRLCCKCSIEIKDQVLEFITQLYASPDKMQYRNIGHLTKRLLNSMPDAEQYSRVPKLLKIPFPNTSHSIIERDFLNPFIFLEIETRNEQNNIKIDSQLLDALLQQAKSDNAELRYWSLTSLIKLYNFKLLSDAEKIKQLAIIIWQKTDKFDLPDGTDFYKFAFLKLPHPEDIDPSQLFKKYVKETAFPIQGEDKGVGITGGDIRLVNNIIGANNGGIDIWTSEDVIEILQRLIEWWDADKNRLKTKDVRTFGFASIPEEFHFRFERAIELLAEVVGFKLSETTSDDTKASLNKLLKEMKKNGFQTLCAEAACIHLYSEQKTELYAQIHEALISNQNNVKTDGIWAINKLLVSRSNDKNNLETSEPLSMLIQYLIWSDMHSITPALWVVISILRNIPDSFSTNLENATQKCLEKLFYETAYDNINSLELTFDEKLEIRRVAALLAAKLYFYYKLTKMTPIPSIIEKWREHCLLSNEFSEIKNMWKNCESINNIENKGK